MVKVSQILDISTALQDPQIYLKLRGFINETVDSNDKRAIKVHEAFETIAHFLEVIRKH